MNPIFQWGLDIIHAVQRVHGPVLDAVFKSVTALGSKDFYFLLFPLLLWSIDFAIGARLAAVFLLSTYVNFALKDLLQLPRPFILDPSVRRYDVEGYGMPSGHAQLSVVIWGTIAHAFRRTWGWVLAAVLAVLIGLSRIYLGVHFPTDVLAGWLIGALLLAAYIVLRPRLEAWLKGKGLGTQLALVVALSLVLLLLHATEDTTSLMGILLGAGVGIALLLRCFEYHAGGPVWKKAVRFLLGIAVLLALRFGLKAILPQTGGLLEMLADFVRYAILGLWAGFGAPWSFRKLRLA